MTDTEIGHLIKLGLGEPNYSPAVAARILDAARHGAVTPHRRTAAPSTARRRLVQRFASLTAALAALCAANVPVLYFVPRYQAAMAETPGIGGVSAPILASVGLKSADVSGASDEATSNGHTLRLVGGYADGLQTVLFVEVDGRSQAAAGPPTKADSDLFVGEAALTDQFGHSYGRSVSLSGDQRPAVFEPLAGPAAVTGGRLTLHVSRLFNTGIGGPKDVEGDWNLHAALISHPARTLTAPQPLILDGNTYTVSGTRSLSLVRLSWQISGPGVDAAIASLAAGQRPLWRSDLDPFMPRVVIDGSTGSLTGGYELDQTHHVVRGSLTTTVPESGRMALRFGSPTAGYGEVQLDIPRA